MKLKVHLSLVGLNLDEDITGGEDVAGLLLPGTDVASGHGGRESGHGDDGVGREGCRRKRLEGSFEWRGERRWRVRAWERGPTFGGIVSGESCEGGGSSVVEAEQVSRGEGRGEGGGGGGGQGEGEGEEFRLRLREREWEWEWERGAGR